MEHHAVERRAAIIFAIFRPFLSKKERKFLSFFRNRFGILSCPEFLNFDDNFLQTHL